MNASSIKTPNVLKRLQELEARYPSSQKLSLNNLKILLNRLNNPQNCLPPVIHIAGTNGKGSTQAILKSILGAAGYRVHAYTSPHLVSFFERIVLNGQQITEQQFVKYLDRSLHVLGDAPISWFELVTAIAFQAFADTPGDVVLLETGLGGRLDATNVIDQPACTIITSISLDHQNVLGSTLVKIAGEKAGIIKVGVPVVMCQQSLDVHRVIADKARCLGSPLFYQTAEWDFKIISHPSPHPFQYSFGTEIHNYVAPILSGQHQMQNAGLALTTLKILQTLFPVKSLAIHAGLQQVKWPARLQNLNDHSWRQLLPITTQLYLDGAHNPGGVESLIAFFQNHVQDQHNHPTIILGALARKDLLELLSPFKGHVQQIIGVPIDYAGAHRPDDIKVAAQALKIPSFSASSIPQALQLICTQQPCPSAIVICGSLYLAGQVLAVTD